MSILDVVDVIDVNGNEGGGDANHSSENMAAETDNEYIQEDNPNSHNVHPYERTLASGEKIWVDGDGNTSVDLTSKEGGGWTQSNPDYRTLVDKG
ncbi:hypothetical protein [Priestia koreensis]|uniref:hypothetical protein n=1 Tax=Priestia koreensis TaxID=284581 RepID=UPI00204204F0|nr:hypothetical protein [Priestia koreensis]MCM3003258.1 hypothetical protein [Priestia koreensis]